VVLGLPLPERPHETGMCIGLTSFFADQIDGCCGDHGGADR
jgi:hypothetical protein